MSVSLGRHAERRPSPGHIGFRLLLLIVTLLTAACGGTSAPSKTDPVASSPSAATADPRAASTNPIKVVAAENFWGSIAAQLGGNRVAMTAIISSPNVDPHDYEATPADARTIATAQLVIVNG